MKTKVKKEDKNYIKKMEALKFLEAIIYAIFIITVIFANSYGSIYIKLIPLLFFLGIIGKVVYGRPIITSIFGGTFSIIVMYVNGKYKFSEILISGLINTILILVGEIFGICIITCAKSINNKNISKGERIKNYFICTLFFVLCIYVTFYINGNIVRYKEAESRISTYLKTNYSDIKFEVQGERYVPGTNRGYIFKVKELNNNRVYKFVVYENEKMQIYDEFNANILKEKNIDINQYIANNINIENALISGKYEKYDKLNLNIEFKKEDEQDEELVSSCIVYIMQKITLYKDISSLQDVNITIKKDKEIVSSATFEYKEYIEKLAKQENINYVGDLLQIEFID